MSQQDRPVKNSFDVICHLCGARKDPGRDEESEGWKYDFYNHNLVCTNCQAEYEQHWPFPHYDEAEVMLLPNGARFTARTFRSLVGTAGGDKLEQILVQFFRDNSVEPIYGENKAVIHPGREIWVYYH